MNIQNYPLDLQILLSGMDCKKDQIGGSTAGAYRYSFLKGF